MKNAFGVETDHIIFKMAWDEKNTPKYWKINEMAERGSTPQERAAWGKKRDGYAVLHGEGGKPPDPSTKPGTRARKTPGSPPPKQHFNAGEYTAQEKANFKANTAGRPKGQQYTGPNWDDFFSGARERVRDAQDTYERTQYGGKTRAERQGAKAGAKSAFRAKKTPANAGRYAKAAWNTKTAYSKSNIKMNAALGGAYGSVIGGAVGASVYSQHKQKKAREEMKRKRAEQRKKQTVSKINLKAPAQFVTRGLDGRALKSAKDLAPEGLDLANGAKVSGHSIKARNRGMRSVRTSISREGKEVGYVDTELTPTRRAFIGGAHVDESERGKGIGTSALKTLTDRAPKSKKVRSVNWTSVGDKSPGAAGTSTTHGAFAWRHGDAHYAKGVGVPKTMAARHKLAGLDPKSKKQAKKYIRRSKMGMQKPKDLAGNNKPKYMSDEAADSVRGMAWWGGVKGGDKSHPIRNTAAVGAVGAAGAEEARDRKKDHGTR